MCKCVFGGGGGIFGNLPIRGVAGLTPSFPVNAVHKCRWACDTDTCCPLPNGDKAPRRDRFNFGSSPPHLSTGLLSAGFKRTIQLKAAPEEERNFTSTEFQFCELARLHAGIKDTLSLLSLLDAEKRQSFTYCQGNFCKDCAIVGLNN